MHRVSMLNTLRNNKFYISCRGAFADAKRAGTQQLADAEMQPAEEQANFFKFRHHLTAIGRPRNTQPSCTRLTSRTESKTQCWHTSRALALVPVHVADPNGVRSQPAALDNPEKKMTMLLRAVVRPCAIQTR